MTKLNSIFENPLYKFLIWAFVGFCVFCVGIFRVNAATYYSNDFTAQLYDNYGPSLSPVTTSLTNNRYQGIIPTMSANTSGGAWGVSSPITLLANHTYTITATIDGTFGGNIILSTYNRIGVGTTLQNAVNSYVNNTNVNENYSRALGDGMTLQFAFTPNINSSYIVFAFATSSGGSNWTFNISSIIVDDLGNDGVTQDEINNSLNNQTNIINNSISNMQENINNNINDNFNNCGENTIVLSPREKGKYINDPYGNLASNSDYNVSKFYDIKPNSNYTINFKNINGLEWGYLCFYNDNNVVSCSQYNQMSGYAATNFVVTSPSNANKITLTYRVNSNADISGNLCINRIDETNDKLDDLNNNLTNDNVSGVDSAFDSFNSFLEDNSTITQLIILPVTLYTSILNNVNGSCMPFNLGTLYGVNLSLPCVNIGSYLGATLWTMIDIIISGFAVYFISKKLVKIFNNVSSLKEGDVIDD